MFTHNSIFKPGHRRANSDGSVRRKPVEVLQIKVAALQRQNTKLHEQKIALVDAIDTWKGDINCPINYELAPPVKLVLANSNETCGHVVGLRCAKELLATNANCPFCRRPIGSYAVDEPKKKQLDSFLEACQKVKTKTDLDLLDSAEVSQYKEQGSEEKEQKQPALAQPALEEAAPPSQNSPSRSVLAEGVDVRGNCCVMM